jgi:hypothetical protein
MTGHPRFPDWECRADLEYVLQAQDMISIDPTYCLMPEASGTTMLESIKDLCNFLFLRLKSVMKRIKPYLVIAWNHIYLFGISFRAWMALALYFEFGDSKLKSPGFHVRALILRCPLVKEHRREAGTYMGVAISKQRADEDSERMCSLVHQMPFMLHKAGSHS